VMAGTEFLSVSSLWGGNNVCSAGLTRVKLLVDLKTVFDDGSSI